MTSHPPRWVGTAVPSRPFADGRTHLDRVPLLSLVIGGLGTTRPTLRPLHKNNEPRTKNTPSAASLVSSCPPVLRPSLTPLVPVSPYPRVPSKAPPSHVARRLYSILHTPYSILHTRAAQPRTHTCDITFSMIGISSRARRFSLSFHQPSLTPPAKARASVAAMRAFARSPRIR